MPPFTRVSKEFVDPPAGIDCDTPAGGTFVFARFTDFLSCFRIAGFPTMPNIGIVDLHSLLCVFDHFASFSSATFS